MILYFFVITLNFEYYFRCTLYTFLSRFLNLLESEQFTFHASLIFQIASNHIYNPSNSKGNEDVIVIYYAWYYQCVENKKQTNLEA